MNICIYRIRAVADGAEAEISIEISNQTESQHIKGTVSASMFADLGLPLSLKSPLSIERERCEAILRCMKLHAAVKKGIYLLGYARNTEKTLIHKLKMKGFPGDIAAEAAAYLREKGYIRENDDAFLFFENLAKHKSYGKNRIRKEMFAKGFSEDVIRETIESSEIDFSEICARRIRSMGGLVIFSSPDQKNKAVASLLRYGFSYNEIREAKDLLCDETE